MREENEPVALREVKHIASLDHQNIIQYFFREKHENYIFLALNYCEGTLYDVIYLINSDQNDNIKYDKK